jgi:hypothetical protein
VLALLGHAGGSGLNLLTRHLDTTLYFTLHRDVDLKSFINSGSSFFKVSTITVSFRRVEGRIVGARRDSVEGQGADGEGAITNNRDGSGRRHCERMKEGRKKCTNTEGEEKGNHVIF